MGRHRTTVALALAAAILAFTTPPATAAVPALRKHVVPGFGVSLGLPGNWVVAAPTTELGVSIPFLARGPLQDGVRANVNLTIQPLPAGMSLRQFMFAGLSGAYKYVGTLTPFDIPGMVGLEYRSTKAFKAGTRPLLTEIFAFKRQRQVFLFTYTALAATIATFGPLFAASAHSIRFTSGAGTTTA